MAESEQNHETKTLAALQFTFPDFAARFQAEEVIEDAYLRYYDICKDLELPGERVAIRRYSTESQEKYSDVLENMESYLQLQQMPGISALVGYTRSEDQLQLLAAFSYNHISLAEIMKASHFLDQRRAFYLIILEGLASLSENAHIMGITIEELVPENILLERQEEGYVVKLLYDEREKKYDQIQKGCRAYVSPERVTAVMEEGEESPVGPQEAVFQLGLLLLDLMQDYERRAKGPFVRDAPLSRSIQSSYLLFMDSSVGLNQSLLSQQIEFLRGLNSPFLSKLVSLIQQMIAAQSQRVSLGDLVARAQALQQQLQNGQNTSEQVQSSVQGRSEVTVRSQFLQTEKRSQQSGVVQQHLNVEPRTEIEAPQQHMQYQTPSKDSADTRNVKAAVQIPKRVITQSTIETELKQKSQETLQLEQKKEVRKQGGEKGLAKLPREQLLQEGKWHSEVMQLLMETMNELDKQGYVVKEYYDKSQYFGEVEPEHQKRQGLGLYVYVQGDVYFGQWHQNSLLQGHYLFRNGESFSGTVRKGKQGWGTYRYANGNVYKGDWKDDLKHGQGTMAYSNQDVYQGQWRAGKKEGQGTYRYSTGAIYRGAFVNGKKHGLGTIEFPEGTRIEAIWNQTSVQGPGKVLYSNGNYFEGNYLRSEKQGEGLYVWEDVKYQGGFEKDAMEGTARISFSETEWYEGKIKNGRRCGKGSYSYPNGDRFDGEWRHDQKLSGRYSFAEGPCFEGRFKQGEISYGVMVYENKESYEGEFAGGQRHGMGTYRDSEGRVVRQGRWQKDEFLSSF